MVVFLSKKLANPSRYLLYLIPYIYIYIIIYHHQPTDRRTERVIQKFHRTGKILASCGKWQVELWKDRWHIVIATMWPTFSCKFSFIKSTHFKWWKCCWGALPGRWGLHQRRQQAHKDCFRSVWRSHNFSWFKHTKLATYTVYFVPILFVVYYNS